ncbi:hypothetical protein [Sphingorhabdus sp.]|uniref:hypothetical protein n=1 Tax=Sphingorhabdus sp. TaxID=1902408 RepID=UPI0039187DCD
MIRLNTAVRTALVCGVVILASAPAFAQANLQPAPAPTILAPANENMIRAGSEVILKTREELTTKKKKLKVGYRFQMEVAEPIRVNNQIIVPAGTPAVGEITEIRNKGMWGKSGYIGARAISMRVGDRTIRLNGSFDDKGVTGTAGVVAAVVLIPVVGFFTTGTSAMIQTGSTVKAFLDEDIAVSMTSTPPPMPLSPIPAVHIESVGTKSQVTQTGQGEVTLSTKPN